jgi:hypothetical protein
MIFPAGVGQIARNTLPAANALKNIVNLRIKPLRATYVREVGYESGRMRGGSGSCCGV